MPLPFDDQLTSRHWDLDRLTSVTDSVFSVALTIQVLTFALGAGLGPQEFNTTLRRELGGIPAYLIGFWVIAMMWRTHHRIFGFLTKQDYRLVFLNFSFLSVICFIPFATDVLAEYGGGRQSALRREVEFPSVMLYAVTVALAGSFLVAIWVYATGRHRLVEADLGGDLITHMAQRSLITPFVFLASIPIALYRPWLAMFSWLAIIPIRWGVNTLWRRRLNRSPT